MAKGALGAKITIEGVDRVVAKLEAQARGQKSHTRVEVGFSAPYSVAVHENLEAFHPRGGQAKYLEAASRKLRGHMADIIRNAIRRKEPLERAQIRAAEALLRLAKELVPVDTGRLRDSGYVRVS